MPSGPSRNAGGRSFGRNVSRSPAGGPSRTRTVAAFAAVALAGLVAAVVVGLTQGSTLVYALGVNPTTPVVQLAEGRSACQGPIRVPDGAEFDRVALITGTDGRPGPELRLVAREVDGGRRLGAGALPEGTRGGDRVIRLGPVQTAEPLELCLVNEGPGSIAIFGQPGVASPATEATVAGRPVDVDLGLTLRAEERSLLALLPDIADRAARFRAGWVTPPVYGLLALAILVGVPLVLGRGLARAAAEDRRQPGASDRA